MEKKNLHKIRQTLSSLESSGVKQMTLDEIEALKLSYPLDGKRQ